MSIDTSVVGGIGVKVNLKETLKDKKYLDFIKKYGFKDGDFQEELESMLEGTDYCGEYYCEYDEDYEYLVLLSNNIKISKIEEELIKMKLFLNKTGIHFYDKINTKELTIGDYLQLEIQIT